MGVDVEVGIAEEVGIEIEEGGAMVYRTDSNSRVGLRK